MVEYGKKKRVYEGTEPVTPATQAVTRQSKEQTWATDLCRVKDCYDGFVSREIHGYSVVFGCPLCDRWKTNVFPKAAIPSLRRWAGRYDQYTDEEMQSRKEDRLSVVESIREQWRRKLVFENVNVG